MKRVLGERILRWGMQRTQPRHPQLIPHPQAHQLSGSGSLMRRAGGAGGRVEWGRDLWGELELGLIGHGDAGLGLQGESLLGRGAVDGLLLLVLLLLHGLQCNRPRLQGTGTREPNRGAQCSQPTPSARPKSGTCRVDMAGAPRGMR